MKIELPSNDEFIIKPSMVGNDMVFLVTPSHISCKWTKQNAIFRSSVWDINGHPVSLGFKKFCNFGEKSETFPEPKSLKNTSLLEKLDGSLLIVSYYKGKLITRTRGTLSAESLDTGYEIQVLKNKYPTAFNNGILESGTCTFLYEWVGANKIVINYGTEPDIYLIGIINHIDYSYWTQTNLDEVANQIGVKRPKRYNFNSIEETLETVKSFKGVEGVCLYYNNDQDIKKIKGVEYLTLHSLKSNLTSDKLAELYFEWNQPSYQEFCNIFEKSFDFECLNFAQGGISSLFDGVKEFNRVMAHLKKKHEERKDWVRKDFAIAAQQEYGSTKKFGVLMNMYLGKEQNRETLKHLLLQNTKQVELKMFSKNTQEEE